MATADNKTASVFFSTAQYSLYLHRIHGEMDVIEASWYVVSSVLKIVEQIMSNQLYLERKYLKRDTVTQSKK